MIRRFIFDTSVKPILYFVPYLTPLPTHQSKIKSFSTKDLDAIKERLSEAKSIIESHNCYNIHNSCICEIKKHTSLLEKLSKDKYKSENTDNLKNKWIYLNDISYNISRSKNKKEAEQLLEELNIKDEEELQNLKSEYFIKFKESLEHKTLIEEKEEELKKWINLYHEFDSNETIYDDEIVQLTKEKNELNKKIKKAYANRKRCLRFTNLPFV
jgi:hypothetical protein